MREPLEQPTQLHRLYDFSRMIRSHRVLCRTLNSTQPQLPPDPHHFTPLIGELVPADNPRILLKGLSVSGGTVRFIHLA